MKFYNTPTRTVQDFAPIAPDKVTIYTCGPTVYDYQHVGNVTAQVRWDTLIRVLVLAGFHPQRVLNITDVGHLTSDADEGEDKMEKGARREGKTAWQIADFYTKDFLASMQSLNWIPPTILAKATDHLPEQIALIQKLEEKGYTYRIDDGIYYNTAKFPPYADFAHLDVKALKAGARVDYNSAKKNPSDFALWKFSPEGKKRDMEWDSPWGRGFPGWHLECSAMALKYLGETIDIHTGGIDHIPVHHTNEIAQSEAATGKKFVNYWLHANFLHVNGTKISKSLQNGFTLADLAGHDLAPLDFRMFVLQSHYRTESNFTWENITAAKHRLQHWRNIAELRWQTHDTLVDDDDKDTDAISQELTTARQAIQLALEDDLNTPEALKIAEAAFDRLNAAPLKHLQQRALIDFLKFLDQAFGLKLLDTTADIDEDQKLLILARERAREAKNWQESDKIRDQLAGQNIHLRDTDHGVVWFYAKMD